MPSLFWNVTRCRFVVGSGLRNILEERRPQIHRGESLTFAHFTFITSVSRALFPTLFSKQA